MPEAASGPAETPETEDREVRDAEPEIPEGDAGEPGYEEVRDAEPEIPEGETGEPEAEEIRDPEPETPDVEMETPEEADEAAMENTEAEEEAGNVLDLEADEAAELKAEEEAERKAEFDALPIHEKAEAGAVSLWKSFSVGAGGLWSRFAAWGGRTWKSYRSLRAWQQVVAAVVAVVLLIGVSAYAYFHSKYILMDISDGVSYSSEFVDNDDEDDEIAEALAEKEDSGELTETEAIEATGDIFEDDNIFNILLIGTDERSEEFSDDSRGDTCMLVSINRSTGAISLVSFERATGVKIPSGEYEGQWDWLTHTFWYGGADMMMQVIRENYRIDVDKYIRVNICTFMELIEAVGGVDVELTEAEADVLNDPTGTYTAMHIKTMHVEDEAQHDLVEGMNHLNGATAMLYVRLRAIDDDWHRVVRQRNVIMAIAENFKKLSLTELDELLNSVLPLVQTNLTEADIASLLADVPSFLNMEFESITFPLANTYGLMDGMNGRRVLAVDFETNSQELQNLLNGDITAEELEEKYENMEGELEDYSYTDSEEWQENYIDAETIAGKYSSSSSTSAESSGTTSDSSSGSSGTVSGSSTGYSGTTVEGSSGYDDAAADVAGDTSSSGDSLGEIESVSTDPDTGVVTTIYYNSSTGVRTAVAVNPDNGATATATSEGTDTAEDTSSAGTAEDTSASDTSGTAEDTSAGDTADTAEDSSAADTASDTSGATDPYSYLGDIESVTVDPDTGVVTTIYYNSATGVRTAVAINPDNGATATSSDDTSADTAGTTEDTSDDAASDGGTGQ